MEIPYKFKKFFREYTPEIPDSFEVNIAGFEDIDPQSLFVRYLPIKEKLKDGDLCASFLDNYNFVSKFDQKEDNEQEFFKAKDIGVKPVKLFLCSSEVVPGDLALISFRVDDPQFTFTTLEETGFSDVFDERNGDYIFKVLKEIES